MRLTGDRPFARGPSERAAGGVLWRRRGRDIELAVVHRPRYGDWTFPKGKLKDDETFEDAAVREVSEETGFDVVPGLDLGVVAYRAAGVPKLVRFWTMRPTEGEFVANPEVDQIRWVRISEAHRLLTYASDREVLNRFRASVGR